MRLVTLTYLLFCFFYCDLFSQTPTQYSTNYSTASVEQSYYTERIPTYTDAELRERLSRLSSAIAPPRFTAAVKSYIKTYTVKKRDKTEKMLGRMSMYFPMFENYLREGGMPVDLKYLSVVESALNPMAVSRSGAVGLWQFMKPTGRETGLKINSTVDERKDPHKSTKAAMKYLSKQFKRYGNWELALAAYNGGPGRVNRAVKRGRSKNFWRIQRYLPRETRNYIPAFIAATYIVNYYDLHNLYPQYPEYDLQNTELIKIYKRISFYEIERVTGTPIHLIEQLNPSYKRRYIPSSSKGNNLVLPMNYMSAMLYYLGRPDMVVKRLNTAPIPAPSIEMEKTHFKTEYITQADENVESVANYFGCSADDIRSWNRLGGNTIRPGTNLTIYVPKPTDQHKFLPLQMLNLKPVGLVKTMSKFESVKAKPMNLKKRHSGKKLKYISSKSADEDYLYYLIRRNETLFEIAEKFGGVNMVDILELNKIKSPYKLKPGMKIKIKRL